MKSARGKILVIRGGAIGDFILTLPVLSALRQQFPEAHLEVLGYPHIVELAVAGGLADRARSIEARPLAGFFARGGRLAEDLVDYFSEFDLIVSYLYDPDEIFQTNVGLCTGAQFIKGPHRPKEGSNLHAARVYLKPLERLAIFDADSVPRLPIGPATGRGNQSAANATLALHPGSGSELKNWPESHWAELLQGLMRTTRIGVLLVGGEAEGERLQRLSGTLPDERTEIAQSLPLAQLARLLARCDAFIGHDSGISHLASAVGVPALLLWGDSAEEVWRPPGDKVTVLRHPQGLDKLAASDVLRQLSLFMSERK